jgi:hypothetical protein
MVFWTRMPAFGTVLLGLLTIVPHSSPARPPRIGCQCQWFGSLTLHVRALNSAVSLLCCYKTT